MGDAVMGVDDDELGVVPGVAGGEGCSTAGGCATCPFMKMNDLDALNDIAEMVMEDSEDHRLKAHLPPNRLEGKMINGVDAIDLGSEPRIPQSRVASLFSSSSNICPSNDRQVMGRSASAFQLFIVGSKQFFRSFDPFLLYLTFSILKQKLSARVGTAIESEKTKCLDVFTLEIAQSDCLFFHSSTYLKKKPSIC